MADTTQHPLFPLPHQDSPRQPMTKLPDLPRGSPTPEQYTGFHQLMQRVENRTATECAPAINARNEASKALDSTIDRTFDNLIQQRGLGEALAAQKREGRISSGGCCGGGVSGGGEQQGPRSPDEHINDTRRDAAEIASRSPQVASLVNASAAVRGCRANIVLGETPNYNGWMPETQSTPADTSGPGGGGPGGPGGGSPTR